MMWFPSDRDMRREGAGVVRWRGARDIQEDRMWKIISKRVYSSDEERYRHEERAKGRGKNCILVEGLLSEGTHLVA